jgi:hypothetical protein
MLARGWLDVLIIGDTRCGKSRVTEDIMQGLRMGEYMKGENISFAGLIGGLQQVGQKTKWDLVWGKIPLNNGRLLTIDEASSLSVETIGNMSAVRSSGIAEITKVQSGVTRAATRLIWLSNPRSDRMMHQYSFGIMAVQELIGRPEDIARFDFVVGVMQEDVPSAVVNMHREQAEYISRWVQLRELVRWVWQLKPQDVIFTEKATEACLSAAKTMAADYSPSIPLVEPNEQRIRVARVAAAVAARTYSEQGHRLIVHHEHVEFAEKFMRMCFDSRALGYRNFSVTSRKDESEITQACADIKLMFRKWTDSDIRSIKLLYGADYFTVGDLETIFNLPRAEARSVCSMLMKHGAIARKNTQFVKTKLGMFILESMMKKDGAPIPLPTHPTSGRNKV